MKTAEDYFADWENHVFGFGYGTGEEHIIPALQRFLLAIPIPGTYDYRTLENAVGPEVAWLLINILCHHDLIEYGTSPRHGWLTVAGLRLQAFCDTYASEALQNMIQRDENYYHCAPDSCNCGPAGYEAGRVCQNPFWLEQLAPA